MYVIIYAHNFFVKLIYLFFQSIPLPGMIGSYSTVFLLRDMAVALSSCIYQSLSDSDAINSKKFTAKDYATGIFGSAIRSIFFVKLKFF